ncbi:hypothetical protein HNR09_000275 [Nesterenkonia xinjiangensis]|uniref:Uncharacterized protein n=1 Tax=Nesterenkonia xinjiangensis TaxID=225327 RepID=A0A7Z0K7T5_9MICC|nr:hypothetical protein [Nesterenkonia xinjiangensis]
MHVDIRQKFEGSAGAIAHLDALLASEAQVLKDRQTHRLTRQLDGGNVAALVFVAFVGG